MNSDLYKRMVAGAVHDVLGPIGFKKRALSFSRSFPEVIQFVTIQSSVSSTSAEVRLTLNLGVLIPSLSEHSERGDISSSQWRMRLGQLLPERSDRWWLLDSTHMASVAATEIVTSLVSYGLPQLDKLRSIPALVEMWHSGKSPGITAVQRTRYLEFLTNERRA